ncbi:DUF2270 domain-containing protein [Rhizobium sp. XQZ8]|nr:DUF2270 domain-containing protein [Rhizobium populisoli]
MEHRTGPPLPVTSSEKVNAVIHYYRGGTGRMTSWRDRIDRTSTWAITVVVALLSISLSTPTSHHGFILYRCTSQAVRKLLHVVDQTNRNGSE